MKSLNDNKMSPAPSTDSVAEAAGPDLLDDSAARIYAALGHPVRLAILRQLIMEEACCCKDIVCRVDLAQSTVSQHLKVLVQSGLVDYRAERQSSRYSVNYIRLASLRNHLIAYNMDCCHPV